MRVKLEPKLAYRTIQGQAVVVVPTQRRVHRLNASGTTLWEWIIARRQKAQREGVSLDELAAVLSERYGLDAASASRDTEAFVNTLNREGVLHPVDSAA